MAKEITKKIIEEPSNFTLYWLMHVGADTRKYTKEHPGQYVYCCQGKAKFFKTEKGLVRYLKKEYGSVENAKRIKMLVDFGFSKLPKSLSQHDYLRNLPFYAAKH